MTQYTLLPRRITIQDSPSLPEKTEVIITHPLFWGGGATGFFHDLCRERLQQGYALLVVSPTFLQSQGAVFQIDLHRPGWKTQSWGTRDFVSFIHNFSAHISCIRINNFHGMFFFSPGQCFELSIYRQITSGVLQLKRERKCGLVYYFHDFLTVCPFLFFVSSRQEYCCPGPDTKQCQECVKHSPPWTAKADPELDMAAWRQCSRNFLAECTQLIFFSLSGVNLLEQILPGVVTSRPERLRIQGQPLNAATFAPITPSQTEKMVIGVIGSIGITKGAKQVLALNRYLREQHQDAEIVLVGNFDETMRLETPGITCTGRYRNEDLPDLIRKHGINVIYFSSVWPETFSRVISEIQMMDLPIALYPLGAPWERLRCWPKAAPISDFTPETACKVLKKLFHDCYPGGR